ncbi:MAG: hypothetical protein KIH62_004490, partial [Candidatus Kerfeldbacteria bacterium]|nr:hypothetical protein [Candidatus Kerfeldbacteria bacterium]
MSISDVPRGRSRPRGDGGGHQPPPQQPSTVEVEDEGGRFGHHPEPAPQQVPWTQNPTVGRVVLGVGVTSLVLVIGLMVASSSGVGGIVAFLALAACPVLGLVATALVLWAWLSGGGGDHGKGSSAPHLDGVHLNNLGLVKFRNKFSGFLSMGNAHWEMLVLRYEYRFAGLFGDIDLDHLHPNGKGVGWWNRFGRHYFVPPWLSGFFVDLSTKTIDTFAVIVPHGSSTKRTVPVTVSFQVIHSRR